MDRHIQDNLDQYLHGLDDNGPGLRNAEFQAQLASADEETRRLVELMATQARLLRTMRVPETGVDDLPGV